MILIHPDLQESETILEKEIKRPDPKIAKQALSEAEERRSRLTKKKSPKEIDGRKGPDPARYGDWENKGIASDF